MSSSTNKIQQEVILCEILMMQLLLDLWIILGELNWTFMEITSHGIMEGFAGILFRKRLHRAIFINE